MHEAWGLCNGVRQTASPRMVGPQGCRDEASIGDHKYRDGACSSGTWNKPGGSVLALLMKDRTPKAIREGTVGTCRSGDSQPNATTRSGCLFQKKEAARACEPNPCPYQNLVFGNVWQKQCRPNERICLDLICEGGLASRTP